MLITSKKFVVVVFKSFSTHKINEAVVVAVVVVVVISAIVSKLSDFLKIIKLQKNIFILTLRR